MIWVNVFAMGLFLRVHLRISCGQMAVINPGGRMRRGVAVDLRKSSKTFGKWVGEILSAEKKQQIWIPPGFAHGFLTLTETAEFLYKTTDYYSPEHERSLLWSDSAIGIEWPLDRAPILAAKDAAAKQLAEAEYFT